MYNRQAFAELITSRWADRLGLQAFAESLAELALLAELGC